MIEGLYLSSSQGNFNGRSSIIAAVITNTFPNRSRTQSSQCIYTSKTRLYKYDNNEKPSMKDTVIIRGTPIRGSTYLKDPKTAYSIRELHQFFLLFTIAVQYINDY